MSTKEERRYIAEELMREIRGDFERWAKEYQQPRDLGALGEFASLYRKIRKLKTLMWPGENSYVGQEWREDIRTIVKEVVSHGLLLLVDLDKTNQNFGKWYAELEDDDEDEEEPFTIQGKKADAVSRREASKLRLRARRAPGGVGRSSGILKEEPDGED